MARNRKKNKKKKTKVRKKLVNEVLLQEDKSTPSLKNKSYRVLTFCPGVIRPPRYIF